MVYSLEVEDLLMENGKFTVNEFYLAKNIKYEIK
jgi:hypothetical protein